MEREGHPHAREVTRAAEGMDDSEKTEILEEDQDLPKPVNEAEEEELAFRVFDEEPFEGKPERVD